MTYIRRNLRKKKNPKYFSEYKIINPDPGIRESMYYLKFDTIKNGARPGWIFPFIRDQNHHYPWLSFAIRNRAWWIHG